MDTEDDRMGTEGEVGICTPRREASGGTTWPHRDLDTSLQNWGDNVGGLSPSLRRCHSCQANRHTHGLPNDRALCSLPPARPEHHPPVNGPHPCTEGGDSCQLPGYHRRDRSQARVDHSGAL